MVKVHVSCAKEQDLPLHDTSFEGATISFYHDYTPDGIIEAIDKQEIK
nr:MAG TPA: hypothetical protein [Caudoviricetes sp.]